MRPSGPKPDALPGCATPRTVKNYSMWRRYSQMLRRRLLPGPHRHRRYRAGALSALWQYGGRPVPEYENTNWIGGSEDGFRHRFRAGDQAFAIASPPRY